MKVPVFLPVLLFLLCPFATSSIASADPVEMVAVTAEPSENNTFDIHLKVRRDGVWHEERRVTSNEAQELHPSVVRTAKGDFLMAWTRYQGVKGVICTRLYSPEKDAFSAESLLPTETVSDIAPALALDGAGKVWLAYSGTGPNGDDIYITSLEGGYWSPPRQVNESDRSPDIRPRFRLNGRGELQLLWEGFQDGGYRKFVSTLSNGRWSREKRFDDPDSGEMGRRSAMSVAQTVGDILPGKGQAAVLQTGAGRNIAEVMRKE